MKIGPSPIIKDHSVVIHGRKTSVSLEPEFWNLLKMSLVLFLFRSRSSFSRSAARTKSAMLSSEHHGK